MGKVFLVIQVVFPAFELAVTVTAEAVNEVSVSICAPELVAVTSPDKNAVPPVTLTVVGGNSPKT
jgi:hypothetical protein